MTHFTVLACLPPAGPGEPPLGTGLGVLLDRALAPYDENREVPAYLDSDGGLTTRNPRSTWDWWVVGGRWRGYFLAAPGAPAHHLLLGEPGVFDNEALTDGDAPRPDGGLVRALDLDRMRDEAYASALDDWNAYACAVFGTPPAAPFSAFRARYEEAVAAAPTTRERAVLDAQNAVHREYGQPDALPWAELTPELRYGPGGEGDGPYWTEREAAAYLLRAGDPDAHRAWLDRSASEGRRAGLAWDAALAYSAEDARRDYAAQPRVAAVRAHPAYADWILDDPVEVFDHLTRDEYAARARARAVPGYALLDAVTPGRPAHSPAAWLAPGKMGWFGLSDETDESEAAYLAAANQLVDALDPDARLVLLDCHI